MTQTAETPLQTLKNREATMRQELHALEANTRQARHALGELMARYAAGLPDIGMDDLQAARKAHGAAYDAEQTHREALDMLTLEITALERENMDAALLRELDTAMSKLALLENDMVRRTAHAERRLREVYAQNRETQEITRRIRARAQQDGFKMLALRGDGVDTAKRVPSAQERERMLDALAAWRIRDDDAVILPDPLFRLPNNAQESANDHTRRWSDLLKVSYGEA